MKMPFPAITFPVVVLAVLLVLGWLGLAIRPASFPPYDGPAGPVESVPLPGGLPAPVERFYRAVYGDRIPVIHSVVISGRADVRPAMDLTFQARFRFIHIAGKSYRHYIEATFFGFPIMQVKESYIDGYSRQDTPFGREEGQPKTEMAANLGMWAELSGVPAVLLTDPRVRWEPLDDGSAVLVVPFEDRGEDHFIVRFGPATGLMTQMETMRYQAKDSGAKTLWVTNAIEWRKVGDYTANSIGSAWWYGAKQPWAFFRTEEIVYNADLGEDINQTGP